MLQDWKEKQKRFAPIETAVSREGAAGAILERSVDTCTELEANPVSCEIIPGMVTEFHR